MPTLVFCACRMAHRQLLGARERKNEIVGTIAEPPNTEADLLDPYLLDPLLEPYILLQVRSTASTIKKQKSGYSRDDPRGSQQGQFSVRIRRFILRLAGYTILVGTGPSSRR